MCFEDEDTEESALDRFDLGTKRAMRLIDDLCDGGGLFDGCFFDGDDDLGGYYDL